MRPKRSKFNHLQLSPVSILYRKKSKSKNETKMRKNEFARYQGSQNYMAKNQPARNVLTSRHTWAYYTNFFVRS